MAWSRSARITLLLVIDVIFFFVELIVGYAVGSLALVADSFHMLNDVLSLIVALYAIKLTSNSATDARYTYGWHRAEILAALVNGVFLLALCFSIFLEALERFFSTPEVSNPKLVVIVGGLGLASNIVGLFLFHEHGHSHEHAHPPAKVTSGTATPERPAHNGQTSYNSIEDSTDSKTSRERSDSYSSLYGHPAATRATFLRAAHDMANAQAPSPARVGHRKNSKSRSGSASLSRRTGDGENGQQDRLSDVQDEEDEHLPSHNGHAPTETTALLHPHSHSHSHSAPGNSALEIATSSAHSSPPPSPGKHAHGHGHGHSHGSMNMRALLLHVLGDALGNVGVIATGLVIWLSSWHFKYYFDPVISLVITVIIFSSALPLVRSTSFILLQGVPNTVSLEAVRNSILAVPGVLSLHELHIWQLSETKIVASVHVTTSRRHDFMKVAAQIREELHHHGIHSSTIQPEYHHDQRVPDEHLTRVDSASCLIVCPPDQACTEENACCPPPPSEA